MENNEDKIERIEISDEAPEEESTFQEEKNSEKEYHSKKPSKIKKTLKKIWHFLWEEESVASYVVFIILAFVILRFIAFPGFLFVTGYSDIAAVVSPSMVRNDLTNHTFYKWAEFNNYSRTDIDNWPFQN